MRVMGLVLPCIGIVAMVAGVLLVLRSLGTL